MVVQDVGQKQEKESGGGEQFKSTGKIKAGGKKKQETPKGGRGNTRYFCENNFGIMILKINFKVPKQVLERKNLAKTM